MLNRRTGGNAMGRTPKGRKCNAVINVASSVGGRGETVFLFYCKIKVGDCGLGKGGDGGGGEGLTAPCLNVVQG